MYHIFSTDFFAVSQNQFVGQVFFYFVKASFGCNFSPALVDNVMIIVMHMSILSCGALFLGPRLPRPGKGPQVTRRMFSVIFFFIAERLLLLSARTSLVHTLGKLRGDFARETGREF